MTGINFEGEWKTSKGLRVVIGEAVEIPAQKVWLGKMQDGREVYFTENGDALFADVGQLIERRRGADEKW